MIMVYSGLNEVYDKVALHLLAQGKKAMDDEGACIYRAPDGCKCAIGALIPDEVYTDSMEGVGIEAVMKEFPVVNKIFAMLRPADLEQLQFIHDSSKVDSWPRKLKLFAELRDIPITKEAQNAMDHFQPKGE